MHHSSDNVYTSGYRTTRFQVQQDLDSLLILSCQTIVSIRIGFSNSCCSRLNAATLRLLLVAFTLATTVTYQSFLDLHRKLDKHCSCSLISAPITGRSEVFDKIFSFKKGLRYVRHSILVRQIALKLHIILVLNVFQYFAVYQVIKDHSYSVYNKNVSISAVTY